MFGFQRRGGGAYVGGPQDRAEEWNEHETIYHLNMIELGLFLSGNLLWLNGPDIYRSRVGFS